MIYEYKCKCGNIDTHSFMVKGKLDAMPCSKCNCSANRLEIPSSVGIQFKGKGFYSTDNSGRKESS